MKATFLFIALVIGVGLILRIFLPSHVGLSFYFVNPTRFVPANVIAFWLSVVIVVVFLIAKIILSLRLFEARS